MAVYKCTICGAIFDEEKEGKKLEELSACPICMQPISKFEKIADAPEPANEPKFEGTLAYDTQYELSLIHI